MTEHAGTAKRNGFSANWSGFQTIASIVSGHYNIMLLTLAHFFVLFLLYLLFLETQGLRLRGFSALLPVLFPVGAFFIYTHLLLNYLRAFIFGPDYVGVWSVRHEAYSEEQTLAAKKLYIRFILSFLILGIPLGFAYRLNAYAIEVIVSITSSGFLVLLMYGIASFIVWVLALASGMLLCTPYCRRAIGDAKMSITDEYALAKQGVEHLTSQEEKPAWIWCVAAAALIWFLEFLIVVSDVNGWLQSGYENRFWGTYVYAFELAVGDVYKYWVLAGFFAFLFVKIRPDVEDEILNKTDQELAGPKRKPKQAGGFMAAVDAVQKDASSGRTANDDQP